MNELLALVWLWVKNDWKRNFSQKWIGELLALVFLGNRFRLVMWQAGVFNWQITCTPRSEV